MKRGTLGSERIFSVSCFGLAYYSPERLIASGNFSTGDTGTSQGLSFKFQGLRAHSVKTNG